MPSSQTLSALQEKGFRTTFRGFDKNDVLAYLNALDNENRQHSAEQEEQIAQLQAQLDKMRSEQSAARAVWKSCKAIFQPLTSAPKLRKNRLPRWSPVPNR